MSTKAIYRISSLDELRGISILMVVFGYAFRNYFYLIDIAYLGVHIFFIISFYSLEKPWLNFRNNLLIKYNK